MRAFARHGWLGSALALACAAEPSPPICPEPASREDPVSVQPTRPPNVTTADDALPEGVFWTCQVPLAIEEEVARMLHAAAAHGTASRSCVDGPGRRVTIGEIVACPLGQDRDRMRVGVGYRVTVRREGDTRACGDAGGCLPPPQTSWEVIELGFAAGQAGWMLQLPPRVPGMPEDATALDRPHDGHCYGHSDPFVPRAIALR